MEKNTAHAILNQVKLGMHFSQGKINEALYVTGDLDINKLTSEPCRPLRTDGLQSCYVRTSQMEYEEIEGRSYWSMDWNRRRNSSQIEGAGK
jgi:hypothetical protein